MNYNEISKSVLGIVSDKRYQWVATILVLFVVLMMSSSIRLSNWDLLTDSTTGEKIPLALDPYYFLRIAETIAESDGDMPEFDRMRYFVGGDTEWSAEIMPEVVVLMWKVSGVFGDYTLREVNVFSPVLFFAVGLILFFILVYVLTNSKFAGVLASGFLAFTPAYLYRTMAGFSDHEAIGMVGFFAAMLGFALALKYMESSKGGSLLGAGVFGGVVGLLTALTISFWGGVSVFLFMIVPIAFLLFWILNTKDGKSGLRNSGILCYICWMIFTVLFSVALGYAAMFSVNKCLIMKRTVIIGGVAGGASAAARLRRLEEEGEIIVLERGPYVSFANCGLPYYVGHVIREQRKLELMTPRRFLARFNINVRINHEALSIDRKNKKVQVKDINKQESYNLEYDYLILSPGASPIVPPFKGIDEVPIFTLRTIPDAVKIREFSERTKIKHATIIGGGFIGLEMAENLKKRGIRVKIIEMVDQVMPNLDKEIAQFIHQELLLNGVCLQLGDPVEYFKHENPFLNY